MGSPGPLPLPGHPSPYRPKRFQEPFDEPALLAEDVRFQQHPRPQRLRLSIGTDVLCGNGHGHAIEGLECLSAAEQRNQFVGSQGAAADAGDGTALVSELLVREGLVAEHHRIPRGDESNRATWHEQLASRRPSPGRIDSSGCPAWSDCPVLASWVDTIP